MREFSQATDIDWDELNAPKIWETHGVCQAGWEQVFFNEPLVVGGDVKISDSEHRYYVLGVMEKGRELFLVFTLRDDRIRVVRGRDMCRKERRIYRDFKEENAT